ncbi:hypothetical protein EK21DRAFT_58434 [Setomelanomma holmii]|uniref:Tail specific protease domain-containing protein n=1 Tax=Setomelanomma holmii TaxID=210430 RepID=A0A9P4HH04_9PLEO|nr:hypothetical protein EK21DRAFT_58434 [Setomelanomma holmii]
MRSFTHLAFVAGAAAQIVTDPYAVRPGSVVDHPLPSISKRNTYAPCADVAELWAAQVTALSKPNATATPIRVPANKAYDCLLTVPVDAEGDLQEIYELKAYLQYQSTLSWLKAGVKDQIKPIDIMGTLDKIGDGIKKNLYSNDYEVQLAIRTLLDSPGDFHLTYRPDITSIFQFIRPEGYVVSISSDGIALPKLYLFTDLPKTATGNITGSAIAKINGQNATEVILAYSQNATYHDVDTKYNKFSPNPALQALETDDGGISYYVYAGPTTTYTHENGSQTVIDNLAVIPAVYDFSNVTDGPSFFTAFCSGPDAVLDPEPSASASASATPKASSTAKPSAVVSATPTPSPSLFGYPKPQFIHSSKKVSGYYLNGTYSDTAVLVLPGMDPASLKLTVSDPTGAIGGFNESQALLRKFLADSVQAGKKKLVIDLRGNGGGTIDWGFEVFKQLFPSVVPYGGSRYRAHPAFQYYSAMVADVAVDGIDKDGEIGQEWDDADYGIQSEILWSNIYNKDLQPFKSFQDYYGPSTINGDTFTSIRRYNFSNNLGGHTLPASLTGYNQFRNTTTQPFESDNIIIIQDGFCGSTCAIFAELMREQGKVQTVAIGGRPQNGPMQGVGGSKGSQRLGFDQFYQWAQRTIKISEELDGTAVSNKIAQTAVGIIYNATQIYVRTTLPETGSSVLGYVNSLNNERMNDSTSTPLEFIYEAADCRLFYTSASYINPVNLWQQVWDAKWGKGKCVPGSTGDKSAIGVQQNKTSFGNTQDSNGQPTQSTGAGSTMGVSSVVMTLAAVVAIALTL